MKNPGASATQLALKHDAKIRNEGNQQSYFSQLHWVYILCICRIDFLQVLYICNIFLRYVTFDNFVGTRDQFKRVKVYPVDALKK
jgi:hypothetical protein